jgi:hypothetical protein
VVRRKDENLRLRVSLKHLQKRQEEPDRSSPIAGLDHDVLGRQSGKVPTPPALVFFSDHDHDAFLRNKPCRTAEGPVEHRSMSIHHRELLGDRDTFSVSR